MSTQLVPVEESQGSLLQVIANATADPRVDVEKMRALLEMKMQVDREAAKREFDAAMRRVQEQMPRITKNGSVIVKGVLRSKYAKIESIDEITRPIYSLEGFSVSYSTKWEPPFLIVTCKVSHSSEFGSHAEESSVPVPIDKNDYRNAAQDMGSTISYGKRYSFCAAFNIVTVDEDTDAVISRPITEAQVAQIEDWMQQTDAKLPNVLKFANVQSLSEIKQGEHFDRVVSALKARVKK